VAVPMNDELQRLWLEQLVREHEDICYQYRVELEPPLFELSSGTREMGAWLPERNTIRISRHLIAEQSWDKVVMVLKHEMAHQMCSTRSGGGRGSHGREFRRACSALGVTPPYNRAGGDLVEVVRQPVYRLVFLKQISVRLNIRHMVITPLSHCVLAL